MNRNNNGFRFRKVLAVFLSFSIALSLAWVIPGGTTAIQAEEERFSGADILAFPGAEGGGAYTSGGRGGDVYIVDSLEDYSESEAPIEGTLRDGIESTPAEGRTIVFHVSGTIELERSLRFANIKNLTIAGQTAPGNGITIAGWDTNISNSENIIIRYIAFRPGATNVFGGSDSMDALWGRDNNYFILDHCSFSWNTDETLSAYRGENGTIQWSIISESLTLSGHSKGRHGYGGIAGGDKTTFHHNLYVSHTSRNPRLGGGYAGAADAEHVAVLQFSNNVVYNYGFNGVYGGGFTFTNFMNNIVLPGPGTRDAVANQIIDAGESGKLGGFYINGNRIVNETMDETTGLLTGSSEHVKNSGDSSGDSITTYATEPFLSADSTGVNSGVTNEAFDDYVTNGVVAANDQLLSDILAQAGATYPRRDAIDARIVAEVEQGLGRYINTENEVGGYISEFGVIEEQRPADFDTNANGMADAWEADQGILNDEDAYQTITDSGYTWLELYINGLVDMDHAAENPDAQLAAPVNNAQIALGDAAQVEVNASSAFGHDIAKVAVYNGSQYLGDAVLDGDKYVYAIEGLADGSYYISARVTDSEGNATQTTAAHVHVNTDSGTLGEDWISADIGTPDVPGTGSMTDGVITVKGSGKLGVSEGVTAQSEEADSAVDDFHYVYQEMTGDMEFTVKLEEIGAVDNHAFTGLMVRDGLTEDSAAAALGLSWVKISNAYCWSVYLAGRDAEGEAFDELTETLDSASRAEEAGFQLLPDIPFKINGVEQGYWLKLGRKGDTFYAYGSLDGEEWTPIGERTIAMDGSVFVGFAVDSNDVANALKQLNYAKYSNISLKDSFKPIGEDDEMGPLVPVDGLTEIDQAEFLTVTTDGAKMVLEQAAAEGKMTKSTADLASNVSYLVFPESNANVTMEMDVTITSTTSASNDMGLYVGAFNIGDNEELFASLGFRNGSSQSLTGIWSKLGKENLAAGNGSSQTNNGSANTKPSYKLGETYHVTFVKSADGYAVHYTGVDENGDPLDATKVFKATEAVLSSLDYLDEEVQLGFALTGVTAEIRNLELKDEYGRLMYAQNPILVTDIAVSGAEGASAITTKSGTLQMNAEVGPVNAVNKAVAWAVYEADGASTDKAVISEGGVLTAAKNGTVKVVATAKDGSGATGSATIAISGQSGASSDGGGSSYIPAPADPGTAWELQEASAVASLEEGDTEAVFPIGKVKGLGDRALEVHSSDVSMKIPSSVLGQLIELLKNGTDADLIVRMEKEDAEEEGTIQPNLKAGSAFYQLELLVKDQDGKEWSLSEFSEPVQIVLPALNQGLDQALLGIYVYEEDAEEWQYVGGKVDADNGTITAWAPHFSQYAVMEFDKRFADVPSTHWAYETLKVLAAKHIVTGMTDTEFEPEGLTTRAEFVKMLVHALGLEASGFELPFADIEAGAWYEAAVGAAYEAGIVNGVTEQEFAPEERITREQMAALLVRAYDYVHPSEAAAEAGNLASYQDGAQVSDWARADVSKAIELGLMQGQTADTFAPQSDAERAETAQAILNLMAALDLM
ncbi:S-layer homology domain-containing protein [Paenibacillus soyae]|uniref:S-layer homology domain-containing protein n=1 Tax=Paenibacillus soyae TaxID=2969249 RepID=A0A9X2SD99_9BACL|nr:S-layer homology domain-containing protein [Paenibacillus soyae]MCR2806872.1 S-layer homology domain-containing protein [Paenibacillus soyae]